MRPTKFIAALCISLSTLLLRAQETPAHPTNRVSVRGSAEIAVVPDKVTIEFSITEQGSDIKKIFQSLDLKTKAIVQIAFEHKLSPKDIQTSDITILSLRGKEEDGRKIINHEATRKLYLILEDYSFFDQLLAQFIDAGVNEISSVTRDIKDRPAVQMKARELAIKAAKAKAEALASALGQNIGKAVNIREDRYDQVGLNFSAEYDSKTSFHGSLSVGKVMVRADVTADFELK